MAKNWFFDKQGNVKEIVSKPFRVKEKRVETRTEGGGAIAEYIPTHIPTRQSKTHYGSLHSSVGFSRVGNVTK